MKWTNEQLWLIASFAVRIRNGRSYYSICNHLLTFPAMHGRTFEAIRSKLKIAVKAERGEVRK